MEIKICKICEKNKTALRCDSCEHTSCKTCVHFIDEGHFAMITFLPDDLKHKTFCLNCYNQGIGERIERYRDVAEKAKNVDVFSKKQSKETRKIKRKENPIYVNDCEDPGETLMGLAFQAADRGFDTLVDVEITSKKIGAGKSYKKLVWSGRGIPVDPKVKK